MSENTTHLLSVKDLHTSFTTDHGEVQAVNGVSFNLDAGKVLGIVGESGSGKSVTAYSIMQILADNGRITSGEILYKGEDISRWGESKMQDFRGKCCSIIFQDPMTSLNPVHSVGDQIAEVVYLHGGHTRQEAKEQACKMLEMVGIPADRYHEYPHQFSGGMKQRVVIAMSIACSPQLILADEPTTALDVTIQAQVLELMNELKQEIKTSVLLITHDLGVVAQVCDRVAIMYCGQIVEQGTIEEVFTHPSHPYTIGLFGSIPTLDSKSDHLTPIEGMVADPTDLPEGCYFAPRCPYACDLCRTQGPASANMGGTHEVRCFAAQGAFPCETLKEVIRIGRE